MFRENRRKEFEKTSVGINKIDTSSGSTNDKVKGGGGRQRDEWIDMYMLIFFIQSFTAI